MLDTLFKTDLSLGPLFATLFLGFTTTVLLLWYSTWKQTYWKKIGIPYVKPFPIVGSAIENLTVPQHELELSRYNKYGRIYGHYEGNRALLSIGDPKILKDILVKYFHIFPERRTSMPTTHKVASNFLTSLSGEDWKRVRAIVSPTFTTGKIKRMIDIFKECSQTLIVNFRETMKKGENIDAKKIYGAFTMDVIASSAFSTKIDSHNDPNNQFVRNAIFLLSRSFSWKLVLAILYPNLVKYLPIKGSSSKSLDFFSEVTLQIIEERKKTGQKRNDFLQLLLDTANELSDQGQLDVKEKDDTIENYGKEDNDQVLKQTNVAKKTLSKEELIAQCVIFFLAGYETTASTLSFISYCLALNPDVQEKLIQELDDKLKENNGDLTYEVIQSMKYLDNVISETLRLFPPLVRLERVANENYRLDDTGLNVPKGMIVTIPIFAIHRDPKNFPDPEKFNPDRFTPEERAKRDQYSYIPFGAGPRNCVGMRFALMEIKTCLAHVLSNFRFRRCPQTKVPLEFQANRNLLRVTEIIVDLEQRNDSFKAI